MRAINIALYVQLLGGDLFAQGSSACVPIDSAPLVEWHNRWDPVTPDSIHKLATTPVVPASGIIEIKGWSGGTPGADPVRIYRTYQLNAFLVTQGGSDLSWEGKVRFAPPSQDFVESFAGNDYLYRGPLLQGVLWGHQLLGALSTEGDSVALEGIINPDGQLEFGAGFYTMDGWWFTAIEWNDTGLRGWWHPSGAVVPDYLGYFCAYRI